MSIKNTMLPGIDHRRVLEAATREVAQTVVDDPKTETILPSRMRHGAQE